MATVPDTLTHANGTTRRPETPVLVVQGAYYLLTGLWPVIDIDSFQAVTGPKTDLWLVRSFGVLIAAVGLTLLVATTRVRTSVSETAWLGITIAVALAAIDVVFVSRGSIGPVYLLDAAFEAALVLWWVWVLSSRRVPPEFRTLWVGLA